MAILDLKDDFGAVGDGVADDTTALLDFFDELRSTGGKGRIPPHDAGKFYKTTQPIVTDRATNIEGPGPASGIIMAVGLPAGSHIIDFDCLASDVVEHVDVSGITLRSDNGLPGAMRVKNASYHHTSNVRAHNVAGGVEYTGTRCFSNSTDRLVGYAVGGSTIKFKDFNGGGHFTFSKGNISGDKGIHVDSDSVVTQMAIDSVNFEACATHSMRVDGTVDGLEMNLRAEAGYGAYDFAMTPVSGHQVTGLSVSGSFFHANSAGSRPFLIGGYGGKVVGFDISGNTVDNAALDYFVFLNGGGNSGTVHSNHFKQVATQAVNGPRLGVRVFSNENATGQCIEYDGAIASTPGLDDMNWTPTDASGAGLVFPIAAGKVSKVGRTVFWQAIVRFPTTSNGAGAALGGLPFPINIAPVVSGRSGGHVDVSNAGIPLGVLQGVVSNSSLSIYSPTAMAAIPNSALSGKDLNLSGSYTT